MILIKNRFRHFESLLWQRDNSIPFSLKNFIVFETANNCQILLASQYRLNVFLIQINVLNYEFYSPVFFFSHGFYTYDFD